MQEYNILLNFFVYGFLGWCSEVAFAAFRERKFVNRGFLNGPVCPIYGFGVITVVNILEPIAGQLAVLYIASAILTTVLEWITGFLLEKLFHHQWWDYSDMPLNLNGYVCLPFSLLWGAACVIIVRWIHPFVERILNFLPLWLGISFLVVFSVLFVVDLYVTVSGILKLNRRLERMEKIARELHSMSDQIGSNISKNVLEGIEKQEETLERAEETLEKAEEKAEELRQKYREIVADYSAVSRRLMKAFPKISSRRYGRQLQVLRENFLKKIQREQIEDSKVEDNREKFGE